MLLILFILIFGNVIANPLQEELQEKVSTNRSVEKLRLERQLKILGLFNHVNQASFNKEHVQIANSYSVEANLDRYSKEDVVSNFLRSYYEGMLPRDHVFSIFHEGHFEQAVCLFNLLYHAKDFDTFYTTAAWARNSLNQGMFLYSFSIAVLHHPSTYGFILPPIYEIYPHYFYNSDVIMKTQRYKQQRECGQFHKFLTFSVIEANYSGELVNVHSEQNLAYFMEDVGMNSFYYYYNLNRPFWMNRDEVYQNTFDRGEEFYYFHQQFLARFYLERLSNNYGKIGIYKYEEPLQIGFTPQLIYPNGYVFPHRPKTVKLNNDFIFEDGDGCGYDYEEVVDFERKVTQDIDTIRIRSEAEKGSGFSVLGTVLEGNIQPHYHGNLQSFSRHLLGCTRPPRHGLQSIPSALEHYETSLRDPLFYQLYKRISSYFQIYKEFQGSYSYSDLHFSGVEIEDIQTDKLTTYFEHFYTDISNIFYVNQRDYENDTFYLSTRQLRLNHKPFSYQITINSAKVIETVVRMFIGPKYDEHGRTIELNENRLNFVEFDTFKYNLQIGKNVIERSSSENLFSGDLMDQKRIHQKIKAAINGAQEFQIDERENRYTFPRRFLLPKGDPNGKVFQFYAIIRPYEAPEHNWQRQREQQGKHAQQYYQNYGIEDKESVYYEPIIGLGVKKLDSYPLGYPFDRPIDKYHFNVPNSIFQDIIIYHKAVDDSDSSYS